jgi:NADH dehydrogenase FAD-containing subunit
LDAQSALHLVNPVRKLLKRVNFFAGEVHSVDIHRKQVVVSHGFDRHHYELAYDHIVFGLGSITNFYNLPGLGARADHEDAGRRHSTCATGGAVNCPKQIQEA